MERTCENCKYSCVDSAIAAVFCMGQKNMPVVLPNDTCKDWKADRATNGDNIRQMSDEELARFVAKARADILRDVGRVLKYPGDLVRDCDLEDAADDWLIWLKQEVESDG